METKPQPLKRPDTVLPSLNAAIDTLDLARDTTSVKPAEDAFRSASHLLTVIRVCLVSARANQSLADTLTQDSMIKEVDCVELGLKCAGVCRVLDQGINGRRQAQLNRSTLEVVERFKM